jgi:hypothetical protein
MTDILHEGIRAFFFCASLAQLVKYLLGEKYFCQKLFVQMLCYFTTGDGRNITACLGSGVKNVKWIEQPENVITVKSIRFLYKGILWVCCNCHLLQ